MRRIPNFVLLRAFEAAARLESFTAAASELSLTPSAISHQVRELEEFFGKALFVRLHRRVELTPEGRRLSEGLTRVLDALEASCAEVRLAPTEEVLAVYCAPSFAAKWLSPRLPGFTRVHPSLTIRMTSGAEPMDLLRASEVDVAISYATAVRRPGIDVVPLGEELVVPLCAPGLVPAGQPARTIINSLTLIESQLSQVTWRDWFALNQIEMTSRIAQSFDRAALAISAAADGMGVTLESALLAARELARGDLVELGAGEFRRIARETHFLSVRTSERETHKVKSFRSWLLSELAVPEKRRAGARKPHGAKAP